MSNRVQFRRYDVGYQPTENLVTQPPDKGSNVSPTLITDLSRAYQELEEKVSILPKLSGLTLDDFVERLAAGFTLVPPKKQNTNLDDLAKKTTNADRIRAMSDKEIAKTIVKITRYLNKGKVYYCRPFGRVNTIDADMACYEWIKWLREPAEEFGGLNNSEDF